MTPERVGLVSRGGFSSADHGCESGSGRGPWRNAGSGTVCKRCPRVASRGGGGAGRSGPLLGDLCRRDAGRVRDDRRHVGSPDYIAHFLWKLLIDERYQRRGFGTATLDLIVEYFRN